MSESQGAPSRGGTEFAAIKAIAGSPNDCPVVMMNLNRYVEDSGYPDSGVYRDYMAALDALMLQVGARVLWRSPVKGQIVGEQALHEILAVWYPSHQAFVDLQTAPGSKENFRLRALCVEEAVIHRCDGEVPPLGG